MVKKISVGPALCEESKMKDDRRLGGVVYIQASSKMGGGYCDFH